MTEPPDTDFNDVLRGAYGTSRSKSARRLPMTDPAELDPEDVRTDAIMRGASTTEADAQARAHHARYGGEEAFAAMLRNDHRQAQERRRKL